MAPEKPGWDIMGEALLRAASKGEGGSATDPLRLPAAQPNHQEAGRSLNERGCHRLLAVSQLNSMRPSSGRI